MAAVTKAEKPISQLERMADWMKVDSTKILQVLNETAFSTGYDKETKKKNAPLSDEELQAAIIVANEYRLNPFLGQIHVTKSRGRLLVIVGVDGWLKIIHDHGDCISLTHEFEHDEKGALICCTCRIVRATKIGDEIMQRSFEATEYLSECFQDRSEPWKKWPSRMLKHKATIQCARYAYGLTGFVDPDEAERFNTIDVEQKPVPRLDINPAPVEGPEPVEQGAG